MIQVYKILDEIKDHFEANEITQKVTYGDETRIDLDKTTMFPLTHIDLLRVEYEERTVVFTVLVMCMDIIDQVKTVDADDEFYGGDNLHDIYNAQFVVLTKFINSLKRGDLFDEGMHLADIPTAEPFQNKYENLLAGWGAEIQIRMQNDISAC